jgi:aminoglycoside phosphotransferase (APT) family kinase protein
MARDWDAEFVVTADLAASLVEQQFAELKPAKTILFASGFDNTAFVVNGQHLFRFPRRSVAVSLLEIESRVLPVIGELISTPVPIPEWIGRPTQLYPWTFAGYPMLPGQPAWAASLSPTERGALAEPIADFLKQLHGVDRETVDSLNLPRDTIGKLDLYKRLPLLEKHFSEFGARNLSVHPADFSYIVEAVSQWADRLSRLCLVHGDFHAGNFLIDTAGKLCGVVDWGDVHVGDPAVDLSCVHGFLPPEFHDQFRNRYGDIDDATWDFARFRALYVAIMVLFYGQDNQLEHAIKEGITALKFLADAEPV